MEARKMKLELMYEVSVGENGVFDGRELARTVTGSLDRNRVPAPELGSR